jgi:hypothetical protein
MARSTRFSCFTLALVAASGATACTGEIGSSEDGPPVVEPPGTPSGQDAGRVTLHRLNRVEYNNTVRDLLGTAQSPADAFPADDHAFGFDNMADTLVLSPVQFELYERASEALADEVLDVGLPSTTTRYEAEVVGGSIGQASGSAWLLWSNGDVVATQPLVSDGNYVIRARAWQSAAGPDAARMTITVGSQSFGPFDIGGSEAAPTTIEQPVALTGNSAIITVSFVNDYVDDVTGDDRNLYVDWVELEGPVGAVTQNPLRDAFLSCDPVVEGEPCVRSIIETFGRRAYRRPLEAAEVDGLVSIFELAAAQGDDEIEGMKLVLRAMLTSAHFLFRVEIDEDPESLTAHPLSDFELATRLSYFLWSSTPDDELLDLAAQKKLQDAATLSAQVKRMLDDPRADALVDNFAGQWLFLRALASREPNAIAFPDFDEELRASMHQEANLFLKAFLKDESLSLPELVTADFSYVDARLSEHYGLGDVNGSEHQKVTFDSAERGGYLRSGAWLTLTSNPDRTSPVKRGKWILENLLCAEPPPPPAGVEGFKPEDLEAKSQAQLLAQHREDPICAACHNLMDPLGLAMENYDGVGAWRTLDHGFPIEPAGEFEGESFASPGEFVDLLAEDERFSECAVEKMMTYALGRGTSESDLEYLAEINDGFRGDGMKLRRLVERVVLSEPFRYRRGEKGGK